MESTPRFARIEQGPCVLYVRPGLEAGARALGLLEPDGLARLLPDRSEPRGRARSVRLELPGSAHPLQLRPVRHGGWWGAAWRGTVAGLARPRAELEVTAQLRARGAPVPRPALLAARRRGGVLWSAALGTGFEPDALDGRAFLAQRPDPASLLRAAEAVGLALRRFHEAGGRHPDLHLGNLLLRQTAGASEALVIDLDGARITAPLPTRARAAALRRLARSLAKATRAGQADPALARRAAARCLAAYLDGDRSLRPALLRKVRSGTVPERNFWRAGGRGG